MHLFEFLLRDFINSERLAHKDSLIVLHDCCPTSVEMTEREHRPDERLDQRTKTLWTGDVWKLLPILRQYRPALKQIVLDCPPTGLVLVANLDPHSNVLKASYPEIIQTFATLGLEDYGLERFRAEFSPLDSRSLVDSRALKRLLRSP